MLINHFIAIFSSENSLKNEDRGVDPLAAPASKPGVGLPTNGLLNSVGGVGMSEQGYKFLEQFNREMLDQVKYPE